MKMPPVPHSHLAIGSRPWLFVVPWLALAGLLAVSGCGRSTRDAVSKETDSDAPQARQAVRNANETADANDSTTAPVGNREIWEVHQIDGTRVGYARTTIRTENADGPPQVQIEGLSEMSFRRAGQGVEMKVQYESTETPDGQLREFTCKVSQGEMLIQQTHGTVEGSKLHLTLTTMGKTLRNEIPWSANYGGLIAGEQSLWRKPMQPGETRTLEALVPGFNQVGKIILTARHYESVEILGKPQELLRVEITTTFAGGQSHRSTLWADRQGEILCRREEAMSLESMRVPKEMALARTDQAPFDLVLGLSVNVDRPLKNPHATRQIRYVLELDDADPAKVFPSGSSQAVKPLGPTKAELTVYAVRPDQPGNPNAPDDPPSEEDLQANNMIQSDSPAIVAMAKQIAPEEKDPWKVAVGLEKYVRGYIVSSDYSQAFATAAQVAESRRGDCTEHAVLLAALARARGIPARVAVGLVYTEQTGQPTFGYHMWDEIYIGNRWIPLDATLARGGIGAAHLKLAHTNLAAASAFTSFLPVAQVAGRLRMRIEAVD